MEESVKNFYVSKYLKSCQINALNDNLEMIKDILKIIDDDIIADRAYRKEKVKSDAPTLDDAINNFQVNVYQKNMRYRVLLLWYEGTYQIWLQGVLGVCNEFLKFFNIKHKKLEDENAIRRFLKRYNCSLKNYKYSDKIYELQKKVNVIKHARGSSYNIVKEKWPDFFITGTNLLGEINDETNFHYSNSGFYNEVFNISIEELEGFTQSLIGFWEWIPETES